MWFRILRGRWGCWSGSRSRHITVFWSRNRFQLSGRFVQSRFRRCHGFLLQVESGGKWDRKPKQPSNLKPCSPGF
uniref:Putative secreted protein n=1 Tax=Anopheles darlingi TaxID=43151 RepID=A0A2M4DB34_ANODA